MKKETKIIIILITIVVLLLSIFAIALVSNRMDDNFNEGFSSGVYELASWQTLNSEIYYVNESLNLNIVTIQKLCGGLNE